MCDDVTQWIRGVADGDDLAAQKIWEGYFDQLLRLARRKLRGSARRVADEEDVVLSAFSSFCQRAKAGSFPRLDDRHDLWKVLVTLIARKAVSQVRHERAKKRGMGEVRGESVFPRHADQEENVGINQVLGTEPTPEFAALVSEECGQLLDQLNDESLRQIALLKLEGFRNEQIAEQIGCTLRTVERKLARIRDKWGRRQSTD